VVETKPTCALKFKSSGPSGSMVAQFRRRGGQAKNQKATGNIESLDWFEIRYLQEHQTGISIWILNLPQINAG
jgi:hypothetical protein